MTLFSNNKKRKTSKNLLLSLKNNIFNKSTIILTKIGAEKYTFVGLLFRGKILNKPQMSLQKKSFKKITIILLKNL